MTNVKTSSCYLTLLLPVRAILLPALPGIGSDILIKDSRPLSNAYAHSRNTVTHLSPLHFVNKGGADTHTAATEGMANRNRAPVDIYNGWVQTKVSDARQRL